MTTGNPAPHIERMKGELFALLKRVSFRRGDFVLASGQRSDYYIDCRRATLDGRGAYLTGCLFYDIIKDWSVDAVGGMTLGADPLVTSVIYRSAEVGASPLSGFLVRKQAKGYGAGRQTEGWLDPWMRVVLLEDVLTTGGSTMAAMAAIRREHPSVEIVHVLALIDRQAGGREALACAGVPFTPLFSVHDFLSEYQ